MRGRRSGVIKIGMIIAKLLLHGPTNYGNIINITTDYCNTLTYTQKTIYLHDVKFITFSHYNPMEILNGSIKALGFI